MKKTLIIFITTQIFLINIDTKPRMISLERIKNKIEKAVQTTAKATKDSFRKIIKSKTQDVKNSLNDVVTIITKNDEPQKKETKANYIILSPTEVLKKIENAEVLISELKWANQTEFLKNLKETLPVSKDKAREILVKKLTEIYPDQKNKLIPLAKDLDHEETELPNKIKELETLISTTRFIKNGPETISTILKLQEKLLECKNTLEEIIETTNNLLI